MGVPIPHYLKDLAVLKSRKNTWVHFSITCACGSDNFFVYENYLNPNEKVLEKPYYDASKKEDFIQVMLLENGEIISEPYIATYNDGAANEEGLYEITVKTISASVRGTAYDNLTGLDGFENESAVFVDYYVEKNSNKTQQIEITADKFGGNYYLEASTLFRTEEGVDLPAEIIIPNCKIQSNFTFTMASSGDPSTFTFTMDAFPDYTRFDNSKKVLAAIQVIDDAGTLSDAVRQSTDHGTDSSMFD